jgi:hypothetical protein
MNDVQEPRRTLALLPSCPSPQELYEQLITSPGWKYKSSMHDDYGPRDRCLVAILYVAELRVSEAIRLVKDQFERKPKDHCVLVKNILLSKRKKGKTAYREARLPLKGERACFTKLIMDYVETLKPEQRLFPFSLNQHIYTLKKTYTTRNGETKPFKSFQMAGANRAWNIVKAYYPDLTEHWLRAFGENYLYDHMDHDIMAVASEVQVDARTLQKYIKRQHEKYKPI